MTHHCPNNNDCAPERLCTPCRGTGIMRDGEMIRVPMMFRDGDPRRAAAQIIHDVSQVKDNGYQASVAALDYRTRNKQPVTDNLAPAPASNAASGQATVDRMRAAQPQVQAAVDRAIKGAARRDHDLTRNGYHLSLDYGPRNA